MACRLLRDHHLDIGPALWAAVEDRILCLVHDY
jgi:hypothetical protein